MLVLTLLHRFEILLDSINGIVKSVSLHNLASDLKKLVEKVIR
jgi:hypothetical protein